MLKKTLKYLGITILALILFVGAYLLAAFGLSRMSVAKEPGEDSDIRMYILTNGVHTDLVVPVRTEYIDWSKKLPFENTRGNDSSAQLIAFGWGDKGFYLETPTWADLKFSTAFKAAFALSESAIHTTYYHELPENKNCVKLDISREQYKRLITFISSRFDTDSSGNFIHIKTNANYGKSDAFYEAKGKYNLFYTCNTWANNGLKSCGQKACVWTPFDTGIFYQYK
jgi:uncharacterized protein (TIGR02117 family)